MDKQTLDKFIPHWRRWVILIATVMLAVLAAAVLGRAPIAEWWGYKATSEMSAERAFLLFFAKHYVALCVAGGGALFAWLKYKENKYRTQNNDFTSAVKLLGEKEFTLRIRGINAVKEMAESNPERFLRQSAESLTAHIKSNAQITAKPPLPQGRLPDIPRILGEDVKAAFAAVDGLFTKHESGDISGHLPPDALDFSNADFSHLNLNNQQVPGLRWFKNWRESDLSGADLHQAELKHADFTGAIMHGADLSRAKLGGANLCDAQLQGASLFHAYLQDPPPVLHHPRWVLPKADFSWATLRCARVEFKLWEAKFFATDFSGAVIKKGPAPFDDMDKKIWFCAEQKEFAQFTEQSKEEWDLESCPSTSVLVGAFRNYAEKGGVDYSKKLSPYFIEAALKLPELPADFPDEWREWLEKKEKEKRAGDSWKIRD